MSSLPVVVYRGVYFHLFRPMLLRELANCQGWNPKMIHATGHNYTCYNKYGKRLWTISVKVGEVRIISDQKKVHLRGGFCFNMVQQRWELS